MAIEKRTRTNLNGKTVEVGWNTKRKCYCSLPREIKNVPVSQSPLEEMSVDELKALATSKGLNFHWNAGKEKLIELLKEAQEQ